MSVEDVASNSNPTKTVSSEQDSYLDNGEPIQDGQDVFPSAIGSPSAEPAQAYEASLLTNEKEIEEGQGASAAVAGSPSREPPEADEDSTSSSFDCLANVWWAKPRLSTAQDDSDIFMEPFFFEDFSCTDGNNAVTPGAEKASFCDHSPFHSESRCEEGTGKSGGASGVSTDQTDPGLSAKPMDALLGEAPDSASNVQQWLESTFQCPSGHCGIREGAQPHDQHETADASDALSGGPKVGRTCGLSSF